MIKTVILTISDTRTKDNDLSGRAILDTLPKDKFTVTAYEIIPDNKDQIKNKLIHYSDQENNNLILTTGGTGLGPRDVTPEATREVVEKLVPGISEYIRNQGLKNTPLSILSRAAAGIRNDTLIINLPGSPKGASESLSYVLEIITHAIDMMKGKGHIKE